MEPGELRDGIAKEVALADKLKKEIPDEYFLIPVRIDDVSFSDFPIEFIRLNGVDCKDNWSLALSKLLKAFERDNVPKSSNAHPSIENWQNIQKFSSKNTSDIDERLQSNWLSIDQLPDQINFFEIKRSLKTTELRVIASECPLPCSFHGRLLVSFSDLDELQSALGDRIPIGLRGSLKTSDFLQGKTSDILGISAPDARNKLSSMFRQAWNNKCDELGMNAYEMANGKIAWWFPSGLVEDDKIRFVDLEGKKRRRSVQGRKGTKEENGRQVPRYYWHLGFTAKPHLGNNPIFIVQPRIIISDDGKKPLENKTKLNSVRRSTTKLWFNDRWRSLIFAYLYWMSDGQDTIELALSPSKTLVLSGRPVFFDCPVGIPTDPVTLTSSDEELEQIERTEIARKTSDPAFMYVDEVDDEQN